MPLEHGSGREVISANIREMLANNHPRAQAIAAAYHEAGEDCNAFKSAVDCAYGDDDRDDFYNNLMLALWATQPTSTQEWNGTKPLTRSDITGDAFALDGSSVRNVDENGHLHVARTPISKAVVSPYYGHEIPDWENKGLEADKIYNLYRDANELKKAASSFGGKPILLKHQPSLAEDHPREITVGAVGEPVEFEGDTLYAPLHIWDQEAIDAVNDGSLRDLSCGYLYDADFTPGTAPDGTPFEGRMVNIRANHLAQVSEGRVPGAYVADGALTKNPNGETDMANRHARRAEASKARRVEAVRKHIEAQPLAKDASIEQVAKLLDVIESADKEPEDTPPVIEGTNETPAPAVDAEHPAIAKAREIFPGITPEQIAALQAALTEGAAPGADEEDPGLEKAVGEENAEAKKVEIPEGEAHDEDDDEKKDEKDMVTKPAMDAAIRNARSEAVAETMKHLKNIREAERAVKPLVGDVSLGLDSAEAIYTQTLKTYGVDTKGVHPSAFPAMVKMLVEKQAAKPANHAPVAMDASATDSFFKMFPGAARIQ